MIRFQYAVPLLLRCDVKRTEGIVEGIRTSIGTAGDRPRPDYAACQRNLGLELFAEHMEKTDR